MTRPYKQYENYDPATGQTIITVARAEVQRREQAQKQAKQNEEAWAIFEETKAREAAQLAVLQARLRETNAARKRGEHRYLVISSP